MRQLRDMTGRRYGRLTVLRRIPTARLSFWLCRCICGKTTTVRDCNLVSRNTKSCGCYGRERLVERATTHGLSYTKEYTAWSNMRARCRDPNASNYERYGGRGIRVCKRWEKFENFFADVGSAPSPSHSIDRYPDNNGDYKPSNVRWATPERQANNRRPRRYFRKPAESRA